jgi:hypothetical protein
MHGHSVSTGIALAGLIIAVIALVFQVLLYRRDK